MQLIAFMNVVPESWHSFSWMNYFKRSYSKKIYIYVDIDEYCECLNKSTPSKLMIFIKLLFEKLSKIYLRKQL